MHVGTGEDCACGRTSCELMAGASDGDLHSDVAVNVADLLESEDGERPVNALCVCRERLALSLPGTLNWRCATRVCMGHG